MSVQSLLQPARSLVGRALRRVGLRPRIPAAPPIAEQPAEQLREFDLLPLGRHPLPDHDRREVHMVSGHELSKVWPAEDAASELGQLTTEGQTALRARFGQIDPSMCHWYHELPMTDGTTMPGAWDLNGGESDYLGDVDLAGKRVFELGPASGHLTWWMEQQGADVVAFDAGMHASLDLIPYGPPVTPEVRQESMRAIAAVHRSCGGCTTSTTLLPNAYMAASMTHPLTLVALM